MNAPAADIIRKDHEIILSMIPPHSYVLDLGCGDGTLLARLKNEKQCRVTGIEIDEKALYQCIEKGLTISHADIDSGLSEYPDKMFDYVILNESLQEVLSPKNTILEALRVGKQVIVGVPNFCQILARLQLFFLGRVPVTKGLPYEWYDTPNLRFFSLKDFKSFCIRNRIQIIRFRPLSICCEISILPNLFAHFGVFLLKK